MNISQPDVGQMLMNVPFAEMLTNVGAAIAKAQAALDQESIAILEQMCEKDTVTLPALKFDGEKITDTTLRTSMIGAGFQPTFYQFAETIIEVKMTINVALNQTEEKKESGEITKTDTTSASYRRYWGLRNYSVSRTVVTTTPVDATYTNKYNFNQEGTSMLRTRLVPVPPNSIIQKQLDLRAQAMQLDYELQLKEYELCLEMLREQKAQDTAQALEETEKEYNEKVNNNE